MDDTRLQMIADRERRLRREMEEKVKEREAEVLPRPPRAGVTEMDAGGTKVRVEKDVNGAPAVVIGEWAHVVMGRAEALMLADALTRLADEAFGQEDG